MAGVVDVDGPPDENLDDLAKVSVEIRDGYVVVQDGHVIPSRHAVVPMKLVEKK